MNLEYDTLEIQFQETIKNSLSQCDESNIWNSLIEIGALGYSVPIELGGYDLGETSNLLVCSELGRLQTICPYIETITISDICQLDSIRDYNTLSSVVEGKLSYAFLISNDLLNVNISNNKLLINGELIGSYAIDDLDFLYIFHRGKNSSHIIQLKKEQMLQLLTPIYDKNTAHIYKMSFQNFEIKDFYTISSSESDYIYAKLILRQAAYLLGLTEGSLYETVAYTKNRKQFNSKLIDFQSIQFKLAEIFAELEAIKMKLNYTTWKWENNKLPIKESLETLALISEKALYTSRQCIHYHGAYGMTKQAKISKYYTLIINEVNRYADYKNIWTEVSKLNRKNNEVVGKLDSSSAFSKSRHSGYQI